jgi:copper transport protein
LINSGNGGLRVPKGARRALLSVLASLWMCAAGSVTASAHTLFIGSDPPEGGVVYTAPDRVNLDFTSPVLLLYSHATLADSQGRQTAIPDSALGVDPQYPTRLVIKLPPLGHDSYRLSFKTRDSVDLHDTEGSIVFGVAVAPSLKAQAAVTPSASWTEVLLRWVIFSGLAGLVGGLLFALFLLPGGVARRFRAKAQELAFWIATTGAALVVSGELGTLVLEEFRAGGAPVPLDRLLLGSSFGSRLVISSLVAAGAGLLTAWLAWNAHRGRTAESPLRRLRRAGLLALTSASSRACLLAVALAGALGMSGHVGASMQPSLGDALVRAAHLLSLSVWVGGLVAIVSVLGVQRALPVSAGWTVLKRFSPVAGAALLVTITSGLLMAGTEVASVTAALSTQYGIALLLKVGLVGLVALLGLRHAIVVARAPRAAQGLPLRTLLVEGSGALLVVLLGAFLGASFPAVGAQFDPPAARPLATQTVDFKDLTVRLSVEPNQPGTNLVAVNVINKRRPVPAPVSQVSVVVGDSVGGSRPVLSATADQGGRYDVGSADLTPGGLRMTVWITRVGMAPIAQTFNWTVPPAPVARHPVVVSNAPVAPAANALAVGLFGLGLLVWLAVFVVRPARGALRLEPWTGPAWPVPTFIRRVLGRAALGSTIWVRH